MITIRLDHAPEVQRRLADAPSAIKVQVLKAVAKHVMVLNQQRLQQQADLDGAAFPPHHARRRRKMLTRLGKRIKILSLNENEAIIGWRSPFEGQLAAKHQFGASEQVTAARLNATGNNSTKPSTRKQAKALLDAGYKRRLKGQGYQTPSLLWITKHLTIAQAGYILTELRGGKKQAWHTRLPPRAVLGVSLNDINTLAQTALQTGWQTLG